MQYNSGSIEDTFKIAKDIAQKFKDNGGLIALSGDLGAGKTTFTQGFAKALNIKDKIISPTFVLIRQHPVPNTKKVLYHIDLYRLEGEINSQDLGLNELWEDKNNIVLIEWAEKIKTQLPKNTIFINIKKTGQDSRTFSITE